MTSEHLQALNIRYLASCGFEVLLGESEDEPRYIPPISWLEPPSEDEGRDSEVKSKRPLLHNGRQVPNHQEFYTRVKELYHSNDEAFRALNQVPSRDKHGHPPIRLAHFRRFWEGLDNMALYWDTSHDQYITPAPQDHENDSNVSGSTQEDKEKHDLPVRESHALSPDPDLEEARKRSKQQHPTDHASTNAHHHYQHSAPGETHHHRSSIGHPLSSSFGLHSLVHSGHHHDPHDPQSSRGTDSPPPGTLYRGARISAGSSMPEQCRADAVRSFVEPIAWSWGLTIAGHRRPTAVSIKNLRCPVRVPGGVWRVPAERERARAGVLEGPALGMSWRGEVEFDGNEGDQVRDLLREVGALYVLAQERAREGKKEVKPGEGKWWTTAPRWGGGAGGEIGEGRGVGDEPVNKEEDQAVEGHQEKPTRRGRERKKFSAVDAWKIVRAGLGFWDPKVQWEAIGKNKGDEYDEVSPILLSDQDLSLISLQVFLVSSLNHHISVLKLRIHALYLDYLATGILPDPPTAPEDWSSPNLKRTRWFDLFVAEDRAEAARGIWGVMAYLARPSEN